MVAHAPETAAGETQLARPSASDASILPTQGVPPVIFICPATSSFAEGVIVQIQTLELSPSTYIVADENHHQAQNHNDLFGGLFHAVAPEK